jgi:hypothetical protein
MSYLEESLDLIDMYELGGALEEGGPPSFNIFGKGLDKETFKEYYPLIRALEDMDIIFNVALNKRNYPPHLQTSGAGGYFSDKDAILLSLGALGGSGGGKDQPYTVSSPTDVTRFPSYFAHEVGHAVMDPTQIWPGVDMRQELISYATDPRAQELGPGRTHSIADYYRGVGFTSDYDFGTLGVGGTSGWEYDRGVRHFDQSKRSKEYDQSVEDFYKFHDLKQQLGEQIFEVTEKTGDLFKDEYGIWGARDINLADYDPSWEEGKMSTGYSYADQRVINTIGSEFLAETLGSKWFETDVIKKGIVKIHEQDGEYNIDVTDLVKIANTMGKADELIELSRKYGGFPEEIWDLFDVWEAGKGKISPDILKKYHGINISGEGLDDEVYGDLK